MTTDETRRRRAAALRYVPGETAAPEVVATGQGRIAERIIEIGREHGIAIHESPELVHVLSRLPSGESIPPELYRAVAEVLVFLMRTAEARRDAPG